MINEQLPLGCFSFTSSAERSSGCTGRGTPSEEVLTLLWYEVNLSEEYSAVCHATHGWVHEAPPMHYRSLGGITTGRTISSGSLVGGITMVW